VNSINTYKGGSHVEYVMNQIIETLLEDISKLHPKLKIKKYIIKNHLSIFINCQIENPSFDTQTKENLTLRSTDFGSECKLSKVFYF
jgi:DNA topoisomerase-2